jgi:hypothetical protein
MRMIVNEPYSIGCGVAPKKMIENVHPQPNLSQVFLWRMVGEKMLVLGLVWVD